MLHLGISVPKLSVKLSYLKLSNCSNWITQKVCDNKLIIQQIANGQ